MAISSWPFDGQSTTEGQYTRLVREFQDHGVVQDGGGLAVSPGVSGLSVSVATGSAVVRGHYVLSDALSTVTLTAPPTGTKVSRIVLRLSPGTNEIQLTAISGDNAGSIPALTRTTTDVYEIPLARVTLLPGQTAVQTTHITDERSFVGRPVGWWVDANGRPSDPRNGQIGYAANRGVHEFYSSTHGWQDLATTPAGVIQMYAGDTPPAGWLLCNGDEFSNTAYPALFAAISTHHGGSATTFKVPDMRDRKPVGMSVTKVLGLSGGSETQTLTVGHMPSHTHSINHAHGMTEIDGSHDHGHMYSTSDGATPGSMRTGNTAGITAFNDSSNGVTTSRSTHAHAIPAYAGASGPAGNATPVPVDVVDPYVALNFIIKT